MSKHCPDICPSTLLAAKLEREEHSHTRSCILVLYFSDISANEHQK